MTPDDGTDAVTDVVADRVEDVWRRESSHVLAALLRRRGDYGDCEDAAQEAMVAAVRQWPRDGMPDQPRAWLITVASRRLVDRHRSQVARRRRETAEARARRTDDPVGAVVADPAVPDVPGDVLGDVAGEGATDADSLRLLLLCCHQSLTRPSQVALTLRAVAGLSVEQIAAAYFVPPRTMTQRLTRARSALRDAGAQFTLPAPEDLPARVAAVLDVCHLVFNAGHLPASGADLVDPNLVEEAIRLTRLLHDAIPDHDEVSGALALMLLTHARAPAPTDDNGDLVALRDQDRGRWDRALVDEGVALLEEVLARSVDDALTMISGLLDDPAMRRDHRTHAVRAHLLEMAGRPDDALAAHREAARLTASLPEQRYLNHQAERLT